MKYIRTKDGKLFAFEVKNETDLDDEFVFMNALILKSVKESFKILKIADTIRELCDEFVMNNALVYSNDNWNTYFYENDIEHKFKVEDKTIIYGAIWVKGEHDEPILKSVAKMNEKGELELL